MLNKGGAYSDRYAMNNTANKLYSYWCYPSYWCHPLKYKMLLSYQSAIYTERDQHVSHLLLRRLLVVLSPSWIKCQASFPKPSLTLWKETWTLPTSSLQSVSLLVFFKGWGSKKYVKSTFSWWGDQHDQHLDPRSFSIEPYNNIIAPYILFILIIIIL